MNKDRIDHLLDDIEIEIQEIDIRDEILSILYKNKLECARECLTTIWFYHEALKKRYGKKLI